MNRFVLLTCTLLLSGCAQDRPSAMLDDYLDRLSNVAQVERQEDEHFYDAALQLSQSLRFPSDKANIYDAQSDHSIGLLDFLSLYGCRLQTLVAERNSNLGKFARPSQQLRYELEFLKYSADCVEQLRSDGSDEALAEQLQAVTTEKRNKLPKHIWQAILNGEEARAFWKQAHDLGDYPNTASIAVLNSLHFIAEASHAWLAGDYEFGLASLEEHLAVLNQPEGGALLKSLILYSLALKEANTILDRASLCHEGRPLFNQIAAQNVVTKFFVGRVQVWASQISQRYYEIIPAYQKLETQLSSAESKAYAQWRHQRDEHLADAIASSQAHVKRLEVLLNACKKAILQGPR